MSERRATLRGRTPLTPTRPADDRGACGRAAAAAARPAGAGRRRRGAREARRRRGPASSRSTSSPSGPDLCLVLGGDGSILYALRRYADTGVPVFGDQLRHGRLPRRGRARRPRRTACAARFAGDFEVMSTARRSSAALDDETPVALNDVSLHPRARTAGSPSSPTGSATRRSGTSAATGWSPRPPRARRATTSPTRADPRLGGGGLRGQLHRPAHADRAGSGRRPRRRPPRRERRRPRAGRGRPRRRARRRAGARARRSRSASATASAASPSSRARTSTSGCARSSAGSLSRPRCARPLGLQADGAQVVDPAGGLRGDVHAAAGHHHRQRRAARDPADLDASFSDLQWVVDAYALSLAGVPARRRARSATGSAAGGSSPGASRSSPSPRCSAGSPATRPSSTCCAALQGVGGAAMFATTLALIAQEFQGRERATAFGIWGATIGGAVAIGPAGRRRAHRRASAGSGSSSSTSRSGSPRSSLTRAQVAESRRPTREPVDWPGVVTFSPSLFAARLRAGPRQRRGLGERPDHRLADRRRRPAGSPSSRSSARSSHADARPQPVPQAGVRRRLDRRLRRSRPRCSRCSSTSRSTCRTSSASRRSRPASRFLPITLLSFFAAPIAGQLLDAGPGRGCFFGRRPRAGRRSGCC